MISIECMKCLWSHLVDLGLHMSISLFMQVEVAVDMQQRYVGHCNTGTDIKQASFLGEKGRTPHCEVLKKVCSKFIFS